MPTERLARVPPRGPPRTCLSRTPTRPTPGRIQAAGAHWRPDRTSRANSCWRAPRWRCDRRGAPAAASASEIARHVIGDTLVGVAAEQLPQCAGIASRTHWLREELFLRPAE